MSAFHVCDCDFIYMLVCFEVYFLKIIFKEH